MSLFRNNQCKRVKGFFFYLNIKEVKLCRNELHFQMSGTLCKRIFPFYHKVSVKEEKAAGLSALLC